jgi:glycosyltransferase involved in cell wall biosynthesis
MIVNRKKIFFVIPSLGPGGAERIISFIAQKLDSSKFEVKLIVIGFEKDSVYIVQNIDIVYLNKTRMINSIPLLFTIFFKYKPSVVLGSISHINILLGFFTYFFGKTKFVGRESTVLSHRLVKNNIRKIIYTKMIIFFYNRLHKIVCQSEDMKQDFELFFQIDTSKLEVINNPITEIKEMPRKLFSHNAVSFITVGRLSEEKGHFRIIEGLSKIKEYNFIYTIVGSGPLLTEIKERTVQLGLREKVRFIPYTSRVLEEINKNDFYIQGSYVEGFPNALLESCSIGTPVIAFNSPGGTKEIVENEVNGFLVENEAEFISILNNIDKLKSIKKDEVKSSVIEKYNGERIIKKYETLFNQY